VNKDWQFFIFTIVPHFFILTFIKQKITQEILSSIYLKNCPLKTFQIIIEVPLINLYLKVYIQHDKENQHSFIIV